MPDQALVRLAFERFFSVAADVAEQQPVQPPSKCSIFVRFFELPAAVPPEQPQQPQQPEPAVVQPVPIQSEQSAAFLPKASLLEAFKVGLSKTRGEFTGKVLQLFASKPKVDEDLIESLETQLIMADVGIKVTQRIISELTSGSEAADGQAVVKDRLKNTLLGCLQTDVAEDFLGADTVKSVTRVVLVVGVNGAGKTTTIGKLALHLKQQGLSVMLAAGDTFRAAAVEQLQVWGERNAVPVVAQGSGADSASVIYDAFASAKAKKVDVLIADTAGRLHNKDHLMEELKKIQRVMQKLDAGAPHETLLVVDGSTGQNALSQGREFHKALGLSGLVITKLDGTAKGGIAFALVDELKVPIRFIGVGEKTEDLCSFSSAAFVDALVDDSA